MTASAQTVSPPAERVTFQEAIDRAVKNNSSTAVAAAGILRAEALARQAQAAAALQVSGSAVVTTLNRVVEFGGATVVPRNQLVAGIAADVPLLAGAVWARRAQAQDQIAVAELSATETRRQVALSTADAYLTVIARQRTLGADLRSRDVARAHFDLASQLEQRGAGSRLNALRAQQQLSTEERSLEAATLSLYLAQEALGVLMVAPGPVDASEDPNFDVDPAASPAAGQLLQLRTDLKLFSAEVRAAERVVRDSAKDRWPTLDALFQPQTIRPANLFSPSTTWQLLFRANVPIFDSGQRAAVRLERQSQLDVNRATLAGQVVEAESQVRTARQSIAIGERGLALARDAARQAQQVVDITNIAFRAGGATNIEVIDAERSARDADLAAAVAEDILRRAKLDLLQALGRFP